MNSDQRTLMQRLAQFEIDAPGATFPYSARLAKENRWSPTYTARVIAEYKRFAFLAREADHMVVPSEIVDEAWHTHLIYTDNYWNQFCETLGKPFHHYPSNGGPDEAAKFQALYEETLTSYERFFGEPPPADIWPRPRARNVAPLRRLVALLMGVSVVAAGCQANPFDWTGPVFLQFYLVLFTAALALSLAVRHLLRAPSNGPADPPLSDVEVGYLHGGERMTLNVVLTALKSRDLITITESTGRVHATGTQDDGQNELEKAVLRRAQGNGRTVEELLGDLGGLMARVAARLEAQGLVANEAQWQRMRWIPWAILMSAPVIGVIKIGVGISRERPVGFLVILCLLSVFAGLAFFATGSRRTRYGTRVLQGMRSRYGHRTAGGTLTWRANPEQMLMGVALFGLPMLASTEHATFARILRPATSGGDAGVVASSCGGGGGCGGGGCGGCGG